MAPREVLDALRAMMLSSRTGVNGLRLDVAVLVIITAVLITLCARMYPKLVQ